MPEINHILNSFEKTVRISSYLHIVNSYVDKTASLLNQPPSPFSQAGENLVLIGQNLYSETATE